MDEDWRNAFEILMRPLGAGPGDVAPKGLKFILYKHSHVAYQIVMKSRLQWCKTFTLVGWCVWVCVCVGGGGGGRACLGVTGGQKVGFGVLFLLSPNSSGFFLARTLKLSQVIAL